MTAASLLHYWRTNAAAAAGVAIAVAVMGGAAAVGDSVTRSLRDLALSRLGGVQAVATGPALARDTLGAESDGAPVLAFEGSVQAGRRRAFRVAVYGVDARFWKLHGGVEPDGIQISGPLASELSLSPGSPLIVRVEKPSAIPREWLHGRRDDAAKAMRFTAGGIAPAAKGGEFSLALSQRDVRAVFVPLRRLQRELDAAGRASAILFSRLPGDLHSRVTLDDLGLALRGDVLESKSAVIGDSIAGRVLARSPQARPSLTYLANSISAGSKAIPYSLVTSIDTINGRPVDGLLLNEWAARDLGVKAGDPVTFEYFVWRDDGRLDTERATFPLAGVVPIDGEAARRDFTPDYPGMTDAATLGDWDPPFPIDLKRVRPRDEEYWKQYRTTPKAFLPLAAGHKLWSSRFGSTTSIRFPSPPDPTLSGLGIDPAAAGFMVRDVRAEAIEASRGSTDFGGYFAAFSFFLVIAAILLAAMFFRLGVEQRGREIGLLRATGYTPRAIGMRFVREAAVVSFAGAAAGCVLAPAYAALVLTGLRTWWSGATGTPALALHLDALPIAGSAALMIPVALLSMAATLRRLNRASARSLLAGVIETPGAAPARWCVPAAGLAGAGAAALSLASLGGHIDRTGGFFGAGFLALAAGLLTIRAVLSRPAASPARSTLGLAWRNVRHRPARTVWCAMLIALATFLLIATGSFRRTGEQPAEAPLYAESMTPLYYNPSTPEGAEALLIPALDNVRYLPFRVKPGDDASCLNLFQPQRPRVLGAPDDWMLSRGIKPGGGALVDANSLQYILHKKVGDTIEIDGAPIRIAGTLHDTIFQSELLITETDFRRWFPNQQGYQVVLIDAPANKLDDVTQRLEDALSDFGFDVERSADRLAAYHRVENTYLETFQALGALGLLLGALGVGALMMRNVFEARRELALLRAVGWQPLQMKLLVAMETGILLAAGLVTGGLAAAIAVAPAVVERGAPAPLLWLAALAAAVFASGMMSAHWAGQAASTGSITAALRSE